MRVRWAVAVPGRVPAVMMSLSEAHALCARLLREALKNGALEASSRKQLLKSAATHEAEARKS